MPSLPTRPEFHCPDGDTLHSLRVKTPIVAVDLAQLRHLARALGKAHAACRLDWLPKTCWAGVPAVTEAFRDAGAAGITCDSLHEAQAAVNALSRTVTILLPPVVGDGPTQLATLARRAAVSVVVDHFAQAERLATTCQATLSKIDLLLRVDVGRERLGVRPGPDLHDLACGLAGLPGVRMAGIAVEITTAESNGVSSLRPAELVRVLARCRTSLMRAGFPAEVVSVSRLADVDDEDDQHRPRATQARTALPDGPGSPFFVVAGVIGRPTRNQAVIDAGREWLGDAASVLGPSSRHARLMAIEDGFAVLHLQRAGHGLVIGDTVALAPTRPLRAPASLVLLDDVHGWRTEPTGVFADTR
ncbi:MAG: alanine racemase [Planctomycetaceae bacterium]